MFLWPTGDHQQYDEQCTRCATVLPTDATVCRVCGLALTIPIQLPAPREAAVPPAA
ncbi:MAG TPA: hypothetical protein VHC43_10880 [Mycobacteriales bacterium]|nr:hypothetical protein [Mycobacteriales bacterium]